MVRMKSSRADRASGVISLLLCLLDYCLLDFSLLILAAAQRVLGRGAEGETPLRQAQGRLSGQPGGCRLYILIQAVLPDATVAFALYCCCVSVCASKRTSQSSVIRLPAQR